MFLFFSVKALNVKAPGHHKPVSKMPAAAVSATEHIESIRKKSTDCKEKITFFAA